MAKAKKTYGLGTNLKAGEEPRTFNEIIAMMGFALGGGILGALFGDAFAREPFVMILSIGVGGIFAGFSQYNSTLGRIFNYACCCLLSKGHVGLKWTPPSGLVRFYAAAGACFSGFIVALVVLGHHTAWGDFFQTAFENPLGFMIGSGLASAMFAWKEGLLDLLSKESTSNNDKLEKAAREGSLTEVEALLAEGVDINGRGSGYDFTALMAASYKGHLEVVKSILAHGAKVDQREQVNDATALMVAAQQGHVHILRALIDSGADISATNAHGVSSLAFAAREGHAPIVRELLKQGADVNALTLDGRSPLMSAAHGGHVDVVKILVANGADMEIKSDKGYTATRYAREWGHTAVLNFLEAHTS